MENSVEIVFYDGQRSQPYTAKLSALDAAYVQVNYGDDFQQRHIYAYEQMIFMGSIGRTAAVVDLPDDARIEFQGEIPKWFTLENKKIWHSIWTLERTPSFILAGVVLLIAFVFSVIQWGIPAAAYYAAQHLPNDTMHSIGDRLEDYVREQTLDTDVALEKQKHITHLYQTKIADQPAAKIIFRGGGLLGANAFALPNNSIIVTDELLEMADNDQQVLAVLAHEQGHLTERHSLQQALTNIGTSALWVSITGDSTDLLTTAPALLLGAHYSRDFESDADDFALARMKQQGISPQHFANFMKKMYVAENNQQPAEEGFINLISSHPATLERIKKAENYK